MAQTPPPTPTPTPPRPRFELPLPALLSSLMEMTSTATPMPGLAGQRPSYAMGGAVGPGGVSQRPSYAMGGAVGPAGMPQRPQLPGPAGTPQMPGPAGVPQRPQMPGPGLGAAPGTAQQVLPGEVEAHAAQFAQQNPQQFQQIQQAIQQALQSGELTMQELTMMVQMAKVAIQNPQMYPQLRALAIQQGLATEQDLSPEFDPGLLTVLITVGKAMVGAVPQGQPHAPVASMKGGGPLPARAANADGSIPINAHEGEYVIPSVVVRAKGTEFFDKLVMQYSEGATTRDG